MTVQTDIQQLESLISEIGKQISAAQKIEPAEFQGQAFDVLGNTPSYSAVSELFDAASIAQEEFVTRMVSLRTRLDEIVKRLNSL